MNTRIRSYPMRRLATALLATSLMVRALVPIGYMPGNLLAGELALLCPAASAATYALLDRDQGHHHHHHGDDSDTGVSMDAACPIGTSLLLDALPTLAPTTTVTTSGNSVITRHSVSWFVARLVATYPARAPPTA